MMKCPGERNVRVKPVRNDDDLEAALEAAGEDLPRPGGRSAGGLA
jgi:hypothetical protein